MVYMPLDDYENPINSNVVLPWAITTKVIPRDVFPVCHQRAHTNAALGPPIGRNQSP